ncbi:protein serine/threonine phosphatase, partial [mine drainage metagenome]
LVRQGEIRPEQAETHPQRHVLTRALGHLPLECDRGAMTLEEHDIVLLCTDGLITALREDEVAEVLQESEFGGIALRLIEAANTAGGPDNTTVVAVRLDRSDIEAVSVR